jgi:GT2 family glycosyltransferase
VTAVSAIVVSYERRDLLATCLDSLERALGTLPGEHQVVVVDNASSDGTLDLVADHFPAFRPIALAENRGFGAAVNAGAREVPGEWLLVLNNDTSLEPDAVEQMLRVADGAPDVGAVAPQIRFASEGAPINSAGIEIDTLAVAYDRLLGAPPSAGGAGPTEVFGASGAAALYRKAMLQDVGGFDESFFLFQEDVDLAWRAQMRGWRCLYTPEAVVHHHHSATARHGSKLKYFHVGRNRVRLLAKNATRSQLRRHLPAILAYDLAYIAFAALTDRTLAPLAGRVAGLREWRRYRRAGAEGRKPVELASARGVRAALARRGTWRTRSSASQA